ncbi:MAG TPA: hypothetical protein VI583_11945 [Cyclobacteriaceae bacterium]|nr:hypothetical protein [Cyclobacteriaceae bacterium]
MNLYYAIGGGLGHLARAQAFLLMQGIEDFKVITASPFASMYFSPRRLILVPEELERSPNSLTVYLQEIIAGSGARSVYLDAFPLGILGELNGIDWGSRSLYYVTRRMKWQKYSAKVRSDIKFDCTFLLEPPDDGHRNFINNSSGEIKETRLTYPHHAAGKNAVLAKRSKRQKWLVVHSGPVKEVSALLARARKDIGKDNADPMLYIITQESDIHDPSISIMNLCPAHGYFKYADRIYSGCGFNIMMQTKPYRDKHHFFPFERKYDDQFWRAEKARKD